MHFQKERFSTQRKSKLLSRVDGPFQVLERINDNVYKIDLPGKYGVSATFNVVDLSPFDVGDDWIRGRFLLNRGNSFSIWTTTKEFPYLKVQLQGREPKSYNKPCTLILKLWWAHQRKFRRPIGDLPYMLCKVELQERDALNTFWVAFNELSWIYETTPRMINKHISFMILFNYNLNICLSYLN